VVRTVGILLLEPVGDGLRVEHRRGPSGLLGDLSDGGRIEDSFDDALLVLVVRVRVRWCVCGQKSQI